MKSTNVAAASTRFQAATIDSQKIHQHFVIMTITEFLKAVMHHARMPYSVRINLGIYDCPSKTIFRLNLCGHKSTQLHAC